MVSSCRLCLTEDPEEKLKNVFQCPIENAEDTLVDVLFWVFSVEIDVTDPFSKNICSECIQLIEYILQVKNTFLNNQKGLRIHLQNQDSESLDVPSLEDAFDKVSNNGPRSSNCTTPPNSPSKSRYHSKSLYGSSSPRVRVSLSTIEAMCPLNLTLEPLETTQDYLRYQRLKNGCFKKRKYRHFNLDGALLNDICNSLEESKSYNTEYVKEVIGVPSEFSLFPKESNPDEKILCTCKRNVASLNIPTVDMSPRDLIINDRTKEDTEDDNFLDIIGITNNVKSALLSPSGEKEDDWTTMTFKKDASTNTDSTRPETKNVEVTAKVQTNTTGTLTKRFKQMKNKNVVKVDINSLVGFCPKVVLEPLEDVLEQINYKQIDNFRYIQNDGSSSKGESEESLEENYTESGSKEILEQNYTESEKVSEQNVEDSDYDEHEQCIATIKKQRFLDYYKNFSSFAVRELIAGKKIRENNSETTPVFKIANVCSVFVCDFCSKSFLSKINLDKHYKRSHKSGKESSDVEVEVIDIEDDKCKTSSRNEMLLARIKKRQKKPRRQLKSNTKIKNNVKNGNYTVRGNVETSKNNANDVKIDSKTSSNNRNEEIKSMGLKRKVQKINYNINDIIRLKTRGKQLIFKKQGKRRRRKKFKQLENQAFNNGEKKNVSYVWDRKSLGKYSAISYYRKYIGDEEAPQLDPAYCDIQHKPDVALNETIQKLADRLDSSITSTEDTFVEIEN